MTFNHVLYVSWILYFAEWLDGKAAPSYGDTCRFKSGLCNSGASAHLGERLFYFIYGSAGRLTWAFTVKPQVRGLIYGGAGRLA